MLLWIAFSVLTAAVLALLISPLQRERAQASDAAAADLEVYRDQLAEIEAERSRGLVSADQLEGARAEIARRLIRRADEQDGLAASSSFKDPGRAQTVIYALAALIPLLSVGGYVLLGAPSLPGRPFTAQQSTPNESTQIAELVARVEARLREHPEDGKGWDVVAPVYLRLERYGDAAHAFTQANRLLGESASRLSGFAEATLLGNNGIVTEDVRRAAERILVLEPVRADAKLWLALAKEQDGDLAGAIAAFEALAAEAPEGSEWREPLQKRIDSLKSRLAGGAAPPAGGAASSSAQAPSQAPRGPTADDMARAREMTPEQQSQMIVQMVDGLAARLKQDGKDLAGWVRLMRAYKVLGRDNDAVAALKDARQNFEGDQKSLAEIDEAAKSLGLGS